MWHGIPEYGQAGAHVECCKEARVVVVSRNVDDLKVLGQINALISTDLLRENSHFALDTFKSRYDTAYVSLCCSS